jgi:hypothetical protein
MIFHLLMRAPTHPPHLLPCSRIPPAHTHACTRPARPHSPPASHSHPRRYLANKCSIASRIDCFLESTTSAFGEKLKEQVEERLRFYEEGVAPRKNTAVMQVRPAGCVGVVWGFVGVVWCGGVVVVWVWCGGGGVVVVWWRDRGAGMAGC